MTTPQLMAHMVSFFPDKDRARRVAAALVDAGVAYLEVQFPFSDPTADGPTIQGACAAALDAGFTLREGWSSLAELVDSGAPPIYLMSYASPVYATGVDRFVARAHEIGIRGLIVPDLPFDSDEGLYSAGRRLGIEIVPVLAPDTGPERITALAKLAPKTIYATLRRGITGTRTEIGSENVALLERLRSLGARVMAGFGIEEHSQVEALAGHCDVAVVGSTLVRSIPSKGDPYQDVRRRAEIVLGV